MTGSLSMLLRQISTICLLLAAPQEHGEAVELSVDTSSLSSMQGERLGSRVVALLEQRLLEQGLTVVADGAEFRIEVEIELVDVDLSHYRISADLFVDERRESVVQDSECNACSEQRVLEQVEGLLPAITERVTVEGSEPEPEPDNDLPVGPQPATWSSNLSAIGFAGAAAIVGGATTLGMGAAVKSLPPDTSVENPVGRYALSPSGLGVGMIVAGSVVSAAGIAALVVDMVVLQPRRRGGSKFRVALDLSPSSAGMLMMGRF